MCPLVSYSTLGLGGLSKIKEVWMSGSTRQRELFNRKKKKKKTIQWLGEGCYFPPRPLSPPKKRGMISIMWWGSRWKVAVEWWTPKTARLLRVCLPPVPLCMAVSKSSPPPTEKPTTHHSQLPHANQPVTPSYSTQAYIDMGDLFVSGSIIIFFSCYLNMNLLFFFLCLFWCINSLSSDGQICVGYTRWWW